MKAGLSALASSIVLYDITNTHFEGLCKSNPKARHGKNKQKAQRLPTAVRGHGF
jgi:hypothetical protein